MWSRADPGPNQKPGWNYLRGIDKLTGKTLWIADDGTTTYVTSVFGRMKDGTPAILTARGGWHDVPERPVGLSLVDLRPAVRRQDHLALRRRYRRRRQTPRRPRLTRRAHMAGALRHALGSEIRLLVPPESRRKPSGDRQPDWQASARAVADSECRLPPMGSRRE